MGLPTGSELRGLGRLARGLRPFAASTLPPEVCDELVRERMRNREARLIAILERAVFPNPGSPYAKLLRAAGAEPEDVRRLIGAEGVEAALQQLHREGVRLSWEEFKGREPAVRGGSTFHFKESDFDNPTTTTFLVGSSGGTSGSPVRVKVDLEFIAESAPNWGVWLEACGLRTRNLVFWTPTHTGLANRYLLCAKLGILYRRWFAMADMRAPFDRLRSGAVHKLCSALLRLPASEPADLEHSEIVMRYMADEAEAGAPPMVNTSPSAAAKVSADALAAGRSLEGVAFLLGAEPITPERRAAMENAGARCIPTYGTSESGWIGAQFPGDPEHDEIRVFRDSYAVLASGGPLEMTSLVAASPKVLLNVELGDSAVATEMAGGEPAARWGYDLKLHTIRSFRKITCFGVTLAVADLYPILEQQLPARFGGGVGDYQLEELQDKAGVSGLLLRIAPRVGAVDEQAVVDRLLSLLAAKRDYYGPMAQMVRAAKAVAVERAAPRITGAGKVFPVLPAVQRSDTR